MTVDTTAEETTISYDRSLLHAQSQVETLRNEATAAAAQITELTRQVGVQRERLSEHAVFANNLNDEIAGLRYQLKQAHERSDKELAALREEQRRTHGQMQEDAKERAALRADLHQITGERNDLRARLLTEENRSKAAEAKIPDAYLREAADAGAMNLRYMTNRATMVSAEQSESVAKMERYAARLEQLAERGY